MAESSGSKVVEPHTSLRPDIRDETMTLRGETSRLASTFSTKSLSVVMLFMVTRDDSIAADDVTSPARDGDVTWKSFTRDVTSVRRVVEI